MNQQDTTLGGSAGVFPQTRWTLILGVNDSKAPQYRENLNYLVSLYWKPVYRYIRCAWRKSNEDAKDLTQSYFISLMERESFQDVTPAKGKFRSFIKASLKHFLMQCERDQSRLKRGGGQALISLDWSEVEERLADGNGQRPEDAFDREWTETLLKNSMARLKAKLDHEGKLNQFTMFHEFYFSDAERLSYEQLAQKYAMSRFDVGNALKAIRGRLREAVMGLITETVTDEVEREREFKELFGTGL